MDNDLRNFFERKTCPTLPLPGQSVHPNSSFGARPIMPDFKEIAKRGWHPDKVRLFPSQTPLYLYEA